MLYPLADPGWRHISPRSGLCLEGSYTSRNRPLIPTLRHRPELAQIAAADPTELGSLGPSVLSTLARASPAVMTAHQLAPVCILTPHSMSSSLLPCADAHPIDKIKD